MPAFSAFLLRPLPPMLSHSHVLLIFLALWSRVHALVRPRTLCQNELKTHLLEETVWRHGLFCRHKRKWHVARQSKSSIRFERPQEGLVNGGEFWTSRRDRLQEDFYSFQEKEIPPLLKVPKFLPPRRKWTQTNLGEDAARGYFSHGNVNTRKWNVMHFFLLRYSENKQDLHNAYLENRIL